MNQSNTRSRTVFKLGGLGDGPHLSCMSSMGLELVIMTILIGSKHCSMKEFPRNLVKKINIWHLLHGITLWTVWIERNDKVFNHEQWHEAKVKHRIWDELIIYTKATWERVIKHIKISSFSAVAMLQGSDQTWGARNVLCRKNNLHITWNWKRQHS